MASDEGVWVGLGWVGSVRFGPVSKEKGNK